MSNVFKSLLLVIAGSTQKELARQIKYLKVENEILRSRLPKRIYTTAKEKQRLIRFGKKIGPAIRRLSTIVAYSTFRAWILYEGKYVHPAKPKGRRTPEQIQRLILKLARENQWGYTRILGELKKLGIFSVSRNTIKRILKDAGLEPGPKRGEGTWDEFLKQHAVSLWQCDFFSKRIWTTKGIREAFVLVFLNVKTRRVVVSPPTFHPNGEWVASEAETFVDEARGEDLPITLVQRDRDSKFRESFESTLRSRRVQVIVGAYRSPNTNAYVERFIQTIQQDCLDRFVVYGERQMEHLCKEFVEHYHEERPHQALDNEQLVKPKDPGMPKKDRDKNDKPLQSLQEIRCEQRLGGLLKHYYRKAA
ncbi:MAG: integrase core domain-containing protein [Pirellulales bacterium]